MPVIALHLLLAIQLVGQDDALARIQARVPVEPIAAVPAELAGKYTTASEELSRRWGGGHLSGEELHLFSDGTYVYCEWADIEPLTVYDRGRWWVHSATLTLESSPDVTWDPGAERRYVVVGVETSGTMRFWSA